MDLFLQYLANGLVNGSTYVLVAVGLTLIFGILGVVNFAHGEFYMIGGYAGIFAVTVLKLPVIPAIAFVLATSAVVGVAAEAILHKPMKNRDATSSIVSSFGIAVALQNAALITMGPQPQRLSLDVSKIPVLSSLPTDFGPVFLPQQRMLIPVTMVVLISLLYFVLRFTWTGRSLRAMAQHSTVARLCGVRVERVAVVTFMTGAALAGIAGMLMSSVFFVYPIVGNMVALKAFTVVILGGMGNVAGAAAAGLLLGVTESLTSAYISNSMRDIVGFVFVIAHSPVPSSGSLRQGGRKVMKAYAGSLLAVALLAIAPLGLGGYETNVLMMILFFVILAVGLDLVTGYCGQFSFATGAFYGIGAYTAAIMSRDLGSSVWVHLPAGAVVAGLFGLLLGIPALRLQGHFLAIVTIAFQTIVYLVISQWTSFTGGQVGLTMPNAGPVTLFGTRFSRFGSLRSYYWLTLVVAVICVFIAWRLVKSRLGREWVAIRDDETLASAVGLNTTRGKLTAFVAYAALAGIAGVLTAHVVARQ